MMKSTRTTYVMVALILHAAVAHLAIQRLTSVSYNS